MDDIRWLTDRETATWSAVRLLGQPLWAALGRDLQQRTGLSMADYQVLVVLSEKSDGVISYRDLAASTGWEKSRLSHQITRMERRGLLHREGCADDGRSANIVLTPAGRRSIEEAAPGHVRAVRRMLIDTLTDDEQELLVSIADRVATVIDRETEAPVGSAGDQPEVG